MTIERITKNLVESGLPKELAELFASGDIEAALWQWENGSKYETHGEYSNLRMMLYRARTKMTNEVLARSNSMPIYGTDLVIPWGLAIKHQARIKQNTKQTLETMRDSGGLTPCEMLAALEERDVTSIPEKDAIARIQEIVSEFQAEERSLALKPLTDEIDSVAMTYDIIAAQGNGIVGARQVAADIRMNIIPAIKRFFSRT